MTVTVEIAGAGPAGLAAALTVALQGGRAIVAERHGPADQSTRDRNRLRHHSRSTRRRVTAPVSPAGFTPNPSVAGKALSELGRPTHRRRFAF
jgi:glycine/D-amino acid oxidase-like deaminating enzyme